MFRSFSTSNVTSLLRERAKQHNHKISKISEKINITTRTAPLASALLDNLSFAVINVMMNTDVHFQAGSYMS